MRTTIVIVLWASMLHYIHAIDAPIIQIYALVGIAFIEDVRSLFKT